MWGFNKKLIKLISFFSLQTICSNIYLNRSNVCKTNKLTFEAYFLG